MYNISMYKCAADDCDRTAENSKLGRLRMGYCDAHYQRIYFHNEVNGDEPIKQYAKRGEALVFLKKAAKTTSNTCILWPYGKDSRGYGQTFYEKKRIKAHRVSLMLKDGIDNPGRDIFACHKCDIPLCVNPNHVYWGDAASNRRDTRLFR